jgi:DNA-3-methyladenine glycosylase I
MSASRPKAAAAIPDLDPVSVEWLRSIGVRSRRDLEKLGAIGAYRALHRLGDPVSLDLVYAIEGALRGVPAKSLPRELRAELRARAADAIKPRCRWCGTDPMYVRYHDAEWGVPVHDDRLHFEFLILEGAQAGLSWSTILRKREHYRAAFAGFDPERVARFGARDVERLMQNDGIVRNRLKVEAVPKNARAFLAVQETCGSFDRYVWDFVGGEPVQNRWPEMRAVPATTPESDALSTDLKRRGFAFVGSTVIYAHMQATGLVNDHTVDCFRHRELAGRKRG